MSCPIAHLRLCLLPRPSSTPRCTIRSCWSIPPRCALSTLFRSRITAGFGRQPLVDHPGQRIEIRPHEEALSGAVAEIAIIGIDHRAHRRDARRHRSHNQLAEIFDWFWAVKAWIDEHRAGDTFGGGTHQRLDCRILLLRGHDDRTVRLDWPDGDGRNQRCRSERCENHAISPSPRRNRMQKTFQANSKLHLYALRIAKVSRCGLKATGNSDSAQALALEVSRAPYACLKATLSARCLSPIDHGQCASVDSVRALRRAVLTKREGFDR